MDSDSDSDSMSSDDSASVVGAARGDFSSEEEEQFHRDLEGIKENDPDVTKLDGDGVHDFIQNITNEQWKEIGRDISNNSHLTAIELYRGAFNDEKISFLFSGLKRSSSIEYMNLRSNGLSMAGVSSMMPFLQNANKLLKLEIADNNIQSEGFNVLIRALRDSPIEKLWCNNCGIESIEIDNEYVPRKLTLLHLAGNNINADGCRDITKVLKGKNVALETLYLNQNKIDDSFVAVLANALRSNTTLTTLSFNDNKVGDEGVSLLVDALQHNTSLKKLHIGGDDISDRGEAMMLKLVNDMSSIKATFQSNHTLTDLSLAGFGSFDEIERHLNPTEIDRHIKTATRINKEFESNPEAAGREKIIQTQLRSVTRVELAKLQGVSQSLYSEINPLHLPEVLSLVGSRHGQGELFDALKLSIAVVISIVDRKHCIEPRLVGLDSAKSAEPHAKRAGIDEDAGNESCSNKRHRS